MSPGAPAQPVSGPVPVNLSNCSRSPTSFTYRCRDSISFETYWSIYTYILFLCVCIYAYYSTSDEETDDGHEDDDDVLLGGAGDSFWKRDDKGLSYPVRDRSRKLPTLGLAKISRPALSFNATGHVDKDISGIQVCRLMQSM